MFVIFHTAFVIQNTKQVWVALLYLKSVLPHMKLKKTILSCVEENIEVISMHLIANNDLLNELHLSQCNTEHAPSNSTD